MRRDRKTLPNKNLDTRVFCSKILLLKNMHRCRTDGSQFSLLFIFSRVGVFIPDSISASRLSVSLSRSDDNEVGEIRFARLRGEHFSSSVVSGVLLSRSYAAALRLRKMLRLSKIFTDKFYNY